MSILEDLEEINRLLASMKMDVKEFKTSEGFEILVVDVFEIVDIPPLEESELQELSPEDLKFLRSQFDCLVTFLESEIVE